MNVVYKTADTSRSGTTVLTADPDLQIPLAANSTYLIRGQVYLRGSTSGDVRHGFSAGGATILRGCGVSQCFINSEPDSTLIKETEGLGIWTAAQIAAGTSSRGNSMITGEWLPVKFSFLLETGGIGGTFALIWAQSTADAVNPAKCLAGSLMTYERLP